MDLDATDRTPHVRPDVPVAPEDHTLSRRARGRHERRDRVYDTAVDLFVRQGFDETSMDEIAAGAGVSRTTVFNHFPRKSAFLEEWSLRRRQRAARSFDRPDSSSRPLRPILEGYFATLALLNTETRTETSALMGPALKNSDPLLGHTLAQDLADLIGAGDAPLRPSATPGQVGRLLALGYYSAVVRWIHVEPAPFPLDAELSALVDTVLSGALTS